MHSKWLAGDSWVWVYDGSLKGLEAVEVVATDEIYRD